LKKFKEYIKNDAAIAQEFELVDMIAHYETGLIDAVNAATQKWEEFKVDAEVKGPIFLKQSTNIFFVPIIAVFFAFPLYS
jgi:hypothetical protein